MSMHDFAVIGEVCPICGQGRLFAAFNGESQQKPYVLCEDCEAEWDSPRAASSADAATHGRHTFSRYAKVDDLQDHPWGQFVINKT